MGVWTSDISIAHQLKAADKFSKVSTVEDVQFLFALLIVSVAATYIVVARVHDEFGNG